MLEKYLIENCSPTLASLKTANLFSCSFTSLEELEENVNEWNSLFEEKGIRLVVLRIRGNSALVYVCRRAYLERDLQKPGVARFLRKYGYESTDAAYAVNRLKERLQGNDGFPHEIGVFLGYPLGDVIGFIVNAGMNSKCSGCWKVYCNECDAVRTFAKYKKCKEIYVRLWNGGRSVWQLTVAA